MTVLRVCLVLFWDQNHSFMISVLTFGDVCGAPVLNGSGVKGCQHFMHLRRSRSSET